MSATGKALTIIEHVCGQDGAPATPSQVATALGLNLATCSRIMVELGNLGYLEQVSRRHGYVNGPLVVALAERPSIYRSLVDHSREGLRELANTFGVTINLPVLGRRDRHILLSMAPRGRARVPFRHNYDTASDFYGTATGRLLLSQAAPATRHEIISRIGLPGTAWDGIRSLPALHAALDRLSRCQDTEFLHHQHPLWIIGARIGAPNLPACACGFGVPADQRKTAVAACRRAVKRILAGFAPPAATGF